MSSPAPASWGTSRLRGVIGSEEFIAAARAAEPAAEFPDPEDVGVVLFTSGTTSRPKAVELTHNNLTSYITGTVEFDGAQPDDAALICVPPITLLGSARRCRICMPAGRWCICRSSTRPNGCAWCVTRGHVGHGRADDARPHRVGAGICPRRATHPAHPGLRWIEGRTSPRAQSTWVVARGRFRQRLRAHRDQFDDRGAHTRRSPRSTRFHRCDGHQTARLGRSAGSGCRTTDPRRKRPGSRAQRNR